MLKSDETQTNYEVLYRIKRSNTTHCAYEGMSEVECKKYLDALMNSRRDVAYIATSTVTRRVMTFDSK